MPFTVPQHPALFLLFSLAAMMGAWPSPAEAQSGLASWYALPGRTACGERMNPAAFTAAHRSLPCGTQIRVTHRRSGKSVVVRVNDRGPFGRGRIVDVSRAAGRVLGLHRSGTAPVDVVRVD
jgi:rare lipoprotein A